MTRSELRLLIKESVYETYTEHPELLQEGLIQNAAEKILKWLFEKLKELSPDTHETVLSLIKQKDKEGLKNVFEDPRVSDVSRTLNEAEAATAGAIDKLKNIVKWIKENKTSLTVYAVLGLISFVLGILHAGDVSTFLIDIGPKIIGTTLAGSTGGFLFGAGADAFSQLKGTGSAKKIKWKDAIGSGKKTALRGLVAGLLAGPMAGVASTLFSAFGIGGAAGAKIMGATAGGAASRLPELIKYVQDLPDGKQLLSMIYSRRESVSHLKDKKEYIENWYKWALEDDQDGLVDSDLNHPDVRFALAKLLKEGLNEKEFEALKKFIDKQHGVVYEK